MEWIILFSAKVRDPHYAEHAAILINDTVSYKMLSLIFLSKYIPCNFYSYETRSSQNYIM
jgi:hypothetical protein